ncbi:MAG: DHH family phosphoesterase [Synergistaceae bacterium]|jgi:phosphoglycolate phosphatase|nr:DHH family phosphoesterase [Synergistaceae bacterium]
MPLLEDLSRRKDIVIQCHDVPDADAIASGFALTRYMESRGRSARLIYSGKNRVTKPNLTLMLNLLDIPLEYVEEMPRCGLLVTVDCQYGAGNVRRFEADDIAVLDHHKPEMPESPQVVIRQSLGSCSTLIWDLMRGEGFGFASSPEVYNALYYGLYTDTSSLAELRHPLDRDLAEFMPADWSLIKRLKNSTLSREELDVVAGTLSSSNLIGGIGLLASEPCDPNILGFSSDIAQQVEQFNSCVVYCDYFGGIKLSVRSSVREIMANELALFLTKDVGSGGGNIEKAGGYISMECIGKVAPGVSPGDFLRDRVQKYQNNFDLVYCGAHNVDFSSFERYRKLRIPLGYAHTSDIFPEASQISVRTLEGDIDTVSSADTYLMIGISGEVYPIKRDRFESSYEILEGRYVIETEYMPVASDKISGERKALRPYARTCVPKEDRFIRASCLVKATKVFSNWDRDKYFYGAIGDFIAASEDDPSDVYIINRDIFFKTYKKVGKGEL